MRKDNLPKDISPEKRREEGPLPKWMEQRDILTTSNYAPMSSDRYAAPGGGEEEKEWKHRAVGGTLSLLLPRGGDTLGAPKQRR